jgi:hypothetical protein
MFDPANSGREIRRRSDALTLEVRPRPDKFPGTTWLPARRVEISESWSTPPEQLRVGESATRRITITGEGLQGAQLPPSLFPTTQGLKYYPDQPVISDSELASGLVGSREDSAALVPTREGSWDIPEIRIPWWDTGQDKVRYAVLPARKVMVAPSLDASVPLKLPTRTTGPSFDTTPITVATRGESAGLWQTIAGVSTAGWILTLLFFALWKRQSRSDETLTTENPTETAAFKALLASCATGDTLQARRRFIEWTAALFPGRRIHSLDQVESSFANAQLSAELDKINDSLYSPQRLPWDGGELALLVKRLRKSHSFGMSRAEPELRLYPQQA